MAKISPKKVKKPAKNDTKFDEDLNLVNSPEDKKSLDLLDKIEKQLKKSGQNHDQQAPDAPKVFRSVGLGEVAVAKGVKKLAKKAKSEVVRLRAYELASKCLRMVSDAPQVNNGIQIVFTCTKGAQSPAGQNKPLTFDLTPIKD
jgi:hypothetical protein